MKNEWVGKKISINSNNKVVEYEITEWQQLSKTHGIFWLQSKAMKKEGTVTKISSQNFIAGIEQEKIQLV